MVKGCLMWIPCKTTGFCIFVAFVLSVFFWMVVGPFVGISLEDLIENILIAAVLLSSILLFVIHEEIKALEKDNKKVNKANSQNEKA